MNKTIVPMLAAVLLLPSCAYMQSNKNILEKGAVYEGTELTKENISLHRKAGEWYIGSPAGLYTKRFPVIHDEVFFKDDNNPTYTLQQAQPGKMYYRISAGTALSLMRSDGYARTGALASEIRSMNTAPLTELHGASTRRILAEVENSALPVTVIGKRSPEKPGTSAQLLAGADKYTLDVLGTVGYNIAIPFMAPFVFFSEFLSED